jgi:hypothetical protein
MQNSAQKHNTSTTKNISLSSINVKNTLEHVKFLTKSEHKVLTKLIEKCRVGRNGHDLTTYFNFSNGQLGYLVGLCSETVRVAKEGLQARGIILIDGMSWDQYQVNVDGKLVRLRTPYSQRIEFTNEFVAWLKNCVANRKVPKDGLWMYSFDYLQKRDTSKFKAAVAKARFNANQLKKVLISMWNSCEDIPKELVGFESNSFGSYSKTKEPNLNNKDIIGNANGYFPSQEKESIKSKFNNQLLANLSSYTQKKVKIWTDATTRICKQLMDSGMTQVEVARAMIHQNYVNSLQEFADKFSPPMNC